ncbi:preprotein translocase subunit YajC [Brucella haematophila]|jgi:preprotein translocase subunit YajC|uniref:Sec translocon accessory complex subunit YajC n=1 Tax=Brucella haematophila TaxID=419474 RepID=A0ABX1DJ29_9HYPH|nr:preprotein translocase subunit YajC [Brucella haematophila]KAB2699163.1 preprotein translocase subunit YajC [Ochrobactrum sp. Kaboul]MBA8819174.1 preprotein translocase subunit YajC [Ochrobactrum sp. P6BSIII]MBA8838566.1 preprotein translocase subunit YajC [Ochrobactrum sp. RH2CCR150]MDH7785289.1 preprotein translocase subunit YajC [Ochrobactrum sp. 19YEA23]OOL17505.1 preprotein translocase subunit YajC [Ochrobactrum sp. P6BS-III]URQ75814.1 MAG: preprotein translocase subunit YajC [Candida
MFVTPAFAQAPGGGAFGPDMLMSILPFILIFVIMYFLIIRPQRTQMKKRQEMLTAVRRGDTVVTGGGIVGKVQKVVDDNEVEVEIAEGVRIKVLRSTLMDVRVKGEPVADNKNK